MDRYRFTARRRTHVQNAHKHPALTIHGVPMRGAAVDTNFADVPGAWQMATKDLEFMDAICCQLRMQAKRLGKRATDLYGDCLKLKLLTPIMAEAFINMVILMFYKDEVRNDPAVYEAFIRSTIPERIAALSDNCYGFRSPIDQTSTIYRDFKRVMDKRNFAIHGNMDPVREQIETVYFEGKRSIFAEGGDNILKFFDHLENLNAPEVVIADYEAVHLFLAEIADYLGDRHRQFYDQVINDPYPGYEVTKKRATRILPDHNVRGLAPHVRYDDELKVTW